MARSSMGYIITYVRRLVNDTGSAVWTDDQIQQLLDRHRRHIRRERLIQDVDEKIYLSRHNKLEGTYAYDSDSGASWDNDPNIIKIWDSDGASANAITPTYWNLYDGSFWWDTDQDDTYYLDAYTYNINRAIAELFRELAADPDNAYKWSRGGVSHTTISFLEMAKHYDSLGGCYSTQINRTYRANG